MIKDKKPLYHSDIQYLESKLHPSVSNTHVSELDSSKISPIKIQGTMPKGWNATPPSDNLDDVTKKI